MSEITCSARVRVHDLCRRVRVLEYVVQRQIESNRGHAVHVLLLRLFGRFFVVKLSGTQPKTCALSSSPPSEHPGPRDTSVRRMPPRIHLGVASESILSAPFFYFGPEVLNGAPHFVQASPPLSGSPSPGTRQA